MNIGTLGLENLQGSRRCQEHSREDQQGVSQDAQAPNDHHLATMLLVQALPADQLGLVFRLPTNFLKPPGPPAVEVRAQL